MNILILKPILSGGLWALVGRMAGVLLAVVINVLLSRILSPEAMGAYFLAFSLVVVHSTLAQLGLSQVVVRLVAESMQREQPGRAAKTIRLVFIYGGLGSATVGGVIFLGVGDWLAEYVFHSIYLIEVMGWIALWVVSFTFQSLFAETFRGFHDIKSAALFGGVTSSIFTILLIVTVWFFYHQSTLERVIVYCVVGVMVSNTPPMLMVSAPCAFSKPPLARFLMM
ncbi:MAG: oligosaccharide flippase family protein [Gallionella sp.]|nr:oligosaccharide flippase family protein [Gallionella sp.]